MSPGSAVVLVLLLALAAWVWLLGIRIVGKVAEGFGEDARHWQKIMLPFGVFGPVIAYVLLSRGGGRGA